MANIDVIHEARKPCTMKHYAFNGVGTITMTETAKWVIGSFGGIQKTDCCLKGGKR